MITIWKYPLELTDLQTVQLPVPYRILQVGWQNGLVFWALVETEGSRAGFPFWVHGTGHPVRALRREEHLGTVFDPRGFVWHVFGRRGAEWPFRELSEHEKEEH